MKFIDEAEIEVWSGDGGRGCLSFRREKYVPKGGPDGGNGGRGGHIVVVASDSLTTLMDVKYRRQFRAGRGGRGKGKRMTGATGQDIIIQLPAGTIIKDAATDKLIVDLDRPGKEYVVATGGRGGRGNVTFMTATNQAPRKVEEGGRGEYRRLTLELKLLAEVGVIGLPNAGKSTLISVISRARPKVADYPFTTLIPTLGVVLTPGGGTYTVADIPGLVEGAHRGTGLGHQFLRHIERTRLLIHLIDLADPSISDAHQGYEVIRKELKAYDSALVSRPEIVVLSKIDLPDVQSNLPEALNFFKKKGVPVLAISAVTREGVKDLVTEVGKRVVSLRNIKEKRIADSG